MTATGERGKDAPPSATNGHVQMYLARGWPLLVCHPRSKEPLTPHGVHDATTDPEVIAGWLRRCPDANLAVGCGHPGPQVLDIDNPGAVPTGVASAVMKAPRTRSARGGAAFFAGTDAGTINLGWGELRGRGGYQLVPPSIHPTGKAYEWLQEPRGPLPPAPKLVEQHGQRAGQGEHKPPPRPIVAGEGRHPYMKDYAVRIVRSGVTDQDRIAAHLEREFELSCEPQPRPRHGYFQNLAKWAAESDIADRERERAENNGFKAHVAGDATSRIVDMAEAIRLGSEPLPYRIDPIAVDGFVTVLAGRRAESKSWLAQFACHAVHRNESAWPLRHRSGRALYLDAEGGVRLMGRRFVQTAMDKDAFVVADGTGLHLPAGIDELTGLVRHVGANLLILDTLRRLAPKMHENDSDDTAPVMAALAGLSRETNCAVVTIHHRSSKWGAADTRGSSAIEDQADIVFVLEKVEGDPEVATRRRLRCTKMRVDREPAPTWLQFKKVAGFMTMSEAEPFERAPDEPRAHELLADRIRELSGEVNGGVSPGELADRLGCSRKLQSFKDAVQLLIDLDEWESTGSTRSRRLRPRFDSTHSPLKGDDTESNQAAPAEQLFDQEEEDDAE